MPRVFSDGACYFPDEDYPGSDRVRDMRLVEEWATGDNLSGVTFISYAGSGGRSHRPSFLACAALATRANDRANTFLACPGIGGASQRPRNGFSPLHGHWRREPTTARTLFSPARALATRANDHPTAFLPCTGIGGASQRPRNGFSPLRRHWLPEPTTTQRLFSSTQASAARANDHPTAFLACTGIGDASQRPANDHATAFLPCAGIGKKPNACKQHQQTQEIILCSSSLLYKDKEGGDHLPCPLCLWLLTFSYRFLPLWSLCSCRIVYNLI